MIQDITYETPFLFVEPQTSGSAVSVTAYSYDGENYDYTQTTGGGETSVIFIS